MNKPTCCPTPSSTMPRQAGEKGELLLEYLGWLRDRILKLRTCEEYRPVVHIDVYGTGLRQHQLRQHGRYLRTLCEAVKPFSLRIEGPMDCDDRGPDDRHAGTAQGLDSAASLWSWWPTSGAIPWKT